jgi:hypothetical protein
MTLSDMIQPGYRLYSGRRTAACRLPGPGRWSRANCTGRPILRYSTSWLEDHGYRYDQEGRKRRACSLEGGCLGLGRSGSTGLGAGRAQLRCLPDLSATRRRGARGDGHPNGRAFPSLDWSGAWDPRGVRGVPADGGEPLLTSLVVRADGTIGDGYAIPAVEREGKVPDDLEQHAANERLRCYRHFGAPMPPDGGRPQLTRQVAERREYARRQAPRTPRPMCPNCFIELPLSGVCGMCEG